VVVCGRALPNWLTLSKVNLYGTPPWSLYSERQRLAALCPGAVPPAQSLLADYYSPDWSSACSGRREVGLFSAVLLLLTGP